ncbi:hypothetical protein CC86DRAFT_368942 [Ophiobolus disseminans]|uniref:RING-type domain-containing protein n=1 Tax=Ophiobolus disseminans TaxID=1469910 RepID=A0A6A7A689_9PLEO|nr:hypothetical protein CC86DRAFT_368942 [Ophiobolus disseminans]
MLLSCVQRLPWPLTCLLFAAVATAATTITPSNATDDRWFTGTLSLRHVETDSQAHIAELVPLTRQAARQTIEGNLFNTNFSTVANLSSGEIAFISCNPNDFSGYADAQRVFEDAYKQGNISGVILYSTANDYCRIIPSRDQDMLQAFSVLSMTNRTASATLRDAIDDLPLSLKYFVKVLGRGDDGNNTGGSYRPQQSNPLGPSPSTAVAMIILYSITGIITALFLVIIVTGAIRAHRHPDRYGPRDVLGRPRQSRARGLGRAILDTIPIVKFGEKEPAKPTDVELAPSAETRDANVANDSGSQTDQAATATNDTPLATGPAEARPASTTSPVEEHHEGIAPAQPAGAAAVGADSASNDENLGCSICTEDFEMGQDLRVLPCDHKFHPECVDPWLLNVSGTCPLCRVDLRPVNTNESSTSRDPDDIGPPLNPEAETAHRHRTAFRDILSLRYRPNATPQERIYYLRRLREQRRNRGDDAADSSADINASNEDVADRRRSKRMSVRLSDVFSGRTRRERSPTQQGESSRSAAQPPPPPPDDSSPADGAIGANGRQA